MTTLSKEDVSRMAEESGMAQYIASNNKFLEHFATLTRADLVAENERLKEENTAFRKAWNADQLFVELRAALAAAEADNERLRNALNEILTTDWVSDRVRRTAKTAIAQPRDDSAPREMIAGVYEECASWYADGGYLLDESDVPAAIRALAEKARHGS